MQAVYQFENAASEREVTVERFGGVDFSTHATKADLTHSPDACNMMAGETDFLVKRPGYKKMAQAEGKVYGLFALPGETGAIVHAGETLFHMSAGGTLTQLCTGMSPAYSFAFRMNGALYLLDGQTYRKVFKQDGSWTVQAVSEAAFVPTTTIAAPPTGGGASLEAGQSADPETHQHLCRQWVGHTSSIWTRRTSTRGRSRSLWTARPWLCHRSTARPAW